MARTSQYVTEQPDETHPGRRFKKHYQFVAHEKDFRKRLAMPRTFQVAVPEEEALRLGCPQQFTLDYSKFSQDELKQAWKVAADQHGSTIDSDNMDRS